MKHAAVVSTKPTVKQQKNASESPKINLSISCEASNCVYNEDKKCSADHIDISGICAQDASETVCASFKCK